MKFQNAKKPRVIAVAKPADKSRLSDKWLLASLVLVVVLTLTILNGGSGL